MPFSICCLSLPVYYNFDIENITKYTTQNNTTIHRVFSFCFDHLLTNFANFTKVLFFCLTNFATCFALADLYFLAGSEPDGSRPDLASMRIPAFDIKCITADSPFWMDGLEEDFLMHDLNSLSHGCMYFETYFLDHLQISICPDIAMGHIYGHPVAG